VVFARDCDREWRGERGLEVIGVRRRGLALFLVVLADTVGREGLSLGIKVVVKEEKRPCVCVCVCVYEATS
jgi:hypothetical protein